MILSVAVALELDHYNLRTVVPYICHVHIYVYHIDLTLLV